MSDKIPIEVDAFMLLYGVYLAARDFCSDPEGNQFHRLQLERAVGSYGEFESRLGKKLVKAADDSVEDSKRPFEKSAY